MVTIMMALLLFSDNHTGDEMKESEPEDLSKIFRIERSADLSWF